MKKLIENLTKGGVNRKRIGDTLEITVDLEEVLRCGGRQALSSTGSGTDEIMRRIVLGRGLHYYLSENKKFSAGAELFKKLKYCANDLHEISNEVYLTGHAMKKAFTTSTRIFDEQLKAVIEFVQSIEGGKEELHQASGVNIDELRKMFIAEKPVKKKLKMLVLRLLL